MPPRRPTTTAREPTGARRLRIALLLALLLPLTALVYARTFDNGFLDFDDPEQVVENTSIRAIDAGSILTCFTTPVLGMYSPLASLSYAVDYRIGGLNVTPYHATNLLLHLLSVTFVCLIVVGLTDSLSTATIVAALFAVHPVQVASVAPIMQRNGLLYCCFYLAAYLAYLSYVRTQKTARLGLAFALFLLSLLSKSPGVVFPLLMLLTDYYVGRAWSRRVLVEKIPFLAASVVFGVLTIIVRPDMAAMKGGVLDYSMIERGAIAAYSLVFYVVALVLPVGLSGLHPYPGRVNGSLPTLIYLAPLASPVVVWIAARARSERRLLVFGGLFILIHLVLLLKIVPFGVEFVSERYLYLPSIGLFLVAAEIPRRAGGRILRGSLVAFAIVVLACSLASYARIGDWQDNVTFYTRVLARYPNSAVVHNNLGGALDAEHRDVEALAHYDAAVRLEPGYVPPHVNLGNALAKAGRPGEAIREFNEALRLEPANAKAHAGLGHTLAQMGRASEAIDQLAEAVRLDPTVAETHNNLGVVLDSEGRLNEALAQYAAALAIDPTWAETRNNMGAALASAGRLDDAGEQLAEAVRLKPDYLDAHRNLALVRAGQRRPAEAIHEFEEALRLAPDDADLHYNLAVLLRDTGALAEAVRHLETAVTLAPANLSARRLLDQLKR